VIAGGESLVSLAGGLLLTETARRSGLSGHLTRLLRRWRLPLATHFDTPQLTAYRAHLQRRRRRFKARTRTYTDSGLNMFEVRLAGARGERGGRL
jgi:hypothetical protein